MRTSYESVTVLRACAQELDAHAFKTAVHARLKGGLPAGGGDGRGGEVALPGFDLTDQDLIRKLDRYTEKLDQAATLLQAILREQRDVLWERPVPVAKAKVLAELGEEGEDKAERVWWCISCARVVLNGYPHHSPIADEKKGGKDCQLCRFCLEWSRANCGKWPDIDVVKARAEGRPIRVKVKP